MDRPVGLTVFGILNIIFSSFAIIGQIISVFTYSLFGSLMPQYYTLAFLIYSGVVSTLISVSLLIAGIGTLRNRKYSRKLTIWTEIISIVIGAINLAYLIFALGQWNLILSGVIGFIFGLIYPILIFWYFNTPKVKEFYKNLK